MEEIFINTVLFLVGFIYGSNRKNNKKLKVDARICTNLDCNPNGYARCLDFETCEKRTT